MLRDVHKVLIKIWEANFI